MSDISSPRIAILTFVVGADYKRNLEDCLKSKRDYAAKHGYTYIEAGEEFWDRERPIAWSKVPFWLDALKRRAADFDYFWISDADVLITNPDLRLEDHVLPLMPAGKALLWNHDACKNLNSGNMIFRCSEAAWLIPFFESVWSYTKDIYHIWYENYAMVELWTHNAEVRARIETTKEHWHFNAYIGGKRGERLWKPSDLLVHFAGVYDAVLMKKFVDVIRSGGTPRLKIFPEQDDAATNE